MLHDITISDCLTRQSPEANTDKKKEHLFECLCMVCVCVREREREFSDQIILWDGIFMVTAR